MNIPYFSFFMLHLYSLSKTVCDKKFHEQFVVIHNTWEGKKIHIWFVFTWICTCFWAQFTKTVSLGLHCRYLQKYQNKKKEKNESIQATIKFSMILYYKDTNVDYRKLKLKYYNYTRLFIEHRKIEQKNNPKKKKIELK